MKTVGFLLTALLILGSLHSSLFAQRLVVTVSPEQPTVQDEVVVTCSGDIQHVLSWDNSFTREDDILVCELRAVHSMLQIQVLYEFSHNFGRLDARRYSVMACLYGSDFQNPNDYMLDEFVITQFTVVPDDAVISLAEGWNLVSSWVEPLNDDVPALMAALVNAGVLNIAKDYAGRFYAPRYEFNNIPGWNFRQGYFLSVTRAAELEISGSEVDADTPIQLQSGWNTVAYFPEGEAEAPDAFRSIRDALRIAKDGAGHFYSPENNFNNLPPLHRGAGYQVNTSEEVVLIWGGR